MIISIDAEKTFDKIQHKYLIHGSGIRREFPQPDKGHQQNNLQLT